MCTAITLESMQKERFFGRTMDFSFPIEPGLYVIPQNHQWNSLIKTKKYTDRYSFISIGQETDGMLGFFDGINERGFAAAVLYFEGYADFDLPIQDKESIASVDFLHYILGRCKSVDDLKALLENICIAGVSDPVTQKVAPLHWMATDKSGKCVVIEQTKTGVQVMDNPIGVMANSPEFNWHMTNLRNYMDVSVTQKKEIYWDDVLLKPFGQAAGTMPLPGGFTSPERFVRTAFLKTHVQAPENRAEALMSCFHIMNSVSIPKGIVQTDGGAHDYTKYIAFINTNTCTYYFKTYENDQIIKASLWDYHTQGTQPIYLGNIVQPFMM